MLSVLKNCPRPVPRVLWRVVLVGVDGSVKRMLRETTVDVAWRAAAFTPFDRRSASSGDCTGDDADSTDLSTLTLKGFHSYA